jgi:FkbM family methyltransferase
VRGGILVPPLSARDTWVSPVPLFWHTFRGTFNPPFRIALPDPATDHNTRVIMTNVYEDALGDVFRVMLAGRCGSASQNAKVLDIGANLGIFMATSAAFGCSVDAVEAQTRLVPYLRETVAANKWEGQVKVFNLAVYDAPGELRIAYYDARQSGWLSMSMDAESLSSCSSTPGCSLETVPVVRTDTLVTQDYLLIKIDVDGPEAVIAKALLPALSRHHVESVLIEVCPPGWKSMIARSDGLAVLHQIASLGYDILLLNQVDFSSYKPEFIARLRRLEGVFRPKAFIVPLSLLYELFADDTTAINCKNIVFTKLDLLLQRFASAGAVLHHAEADAR